MQYHHFFLMAHTYIQYQHLFKGINFALQVLLPILPKKKALSKRLDKECKMVQG